MARRAITVLAVGLLFLAVQTASAQNEGNTIQPDPEEANTRVGTRGANFLHLGVGARGLAMAGAGATLQEGVFAMYWNPAGIAYNEGFAAALSYSNLYGDLGVDYFFVGGTIPFVGGALGLSYGGLTSGDITRTTEAFPDGGDPTFGSTYSWTSSFVGAYYAIPITDRLNFGGGLKFIQEGIDDANAEWIGLDAGVTFRTGLYGIELGATAQNIGGESEFKGSAVQRVLNSANQIFAPNGRNLQTEFNTRSVQLPTLFRFTLKLDMVGSAESLLSPNPDHTLDASLDVMDAVDSDVQAGVGVEYSFRKIGFLRAGKRWVNESQRTGAIQESVGGEAGLFRSGDFRDFSYGLSFGGGLRIPILGRGLAFDYAYVDMGELDNVQVFSFEFGF